MRSSVAGLPLAVGLALADRMLGRDRVTACFFGEGAVAEGAFHEAMNLAALWKLPVLFCCENNGYAMGTSLARVAVADGPLRARRRVMRCRRRPSTAWMSSRCCSRRARRGDGARGRAARIFLEFRTYRFRAHSMFDPELYRDKGEVALWRQRGPLHTFTDRLKAQGDFSERDFLALEAEVATELRGAIDFAERSPLEPVETLLQDVHTPAAGRERDDLPRGVARGAAGSARRRPACPAAGRGRRALRRHVRRQQGPAGGVRRRIASAIRRYPSWVSPAPPSVRRSADCGRSSRS